MPCDHRDRDWNDAAKSQRIPKIASHNQKLGRNKERFYPEPQKGNMTLLTPSFQTCGLQNCERLNVCYLKPPVCDTILAALRN